MTLPFLPVGRDGCSCNSFWTLLWLSGPVAVQIHPQIDVWKRCNESWQLLLLIQAGLAEQAPADSAGFCCPASRLLELRSRVWGEEKSLCSLIAAWDGWSEKDIGERAGVVLCSPWLWVINSARPHSATHVVFSKWTAGRRPAQLSEMWCTEWS